MSRAALPLIEGAEVIRSPRCPSHARAWLGGPERRSALRARAAARVEPRRPATDPEVIAGARLTPRIFREPGELNLPATRNPHTKNLKISGSVQNDFLRWG